VLLFPVVWDRFFAASYAIIMISLLAAQRSATRPSDERAPARSVRIILPVRDLRGGGLPAKPAVAPADR
jgi:alpha-D-ribose 1-methylphosphonate 5-triphosphate synthase subunit PhnH